METTIFGKLGLVFASTVLLLAVARRGHALGYDTAIFYGDRTNGKFGLGYGNSFSEAGDKAKKSCEAVGGKKCVPVLTCTQAGYSALGVLIRQGEYIFPGVCGVSDALSARAKVTNLCRQQTKKDCIDTKVAVAID